MTKANGNQSGCEGFPFHLNLKLQPTSTSDIQIVFSCLASSCLPPSSSSSSSFLPFTPFLQDPTRKGVLRVPFSPGPKKIPHWKPEGPPKEGPFHVSRDGFFVLRSGSWPLLPFKQEDGNDDRLSLGDGGDETVGVQTTDDKGAFFVGFLVEELFLSYFGWGGILGFVGSLFLLLAGFVCRGQRK